MLLKKSFAIDAVDAHGNTALHRAVSNRRVDVCAMLLEQGAAVNHVGGHGNNTALHLAAYDGLADMCAMLLEHGAAIDALDKNGATAFDIATNRGKTNVCSVLLEGGLPKQGRV